ncbi:MULTISPECIES: GNAT family N-acetyltransferase [Planococcus]|uniref:GNAT family N-acetyltransferase n=1 Tax=Planococcus faecalis TaxID=1598147 RepID=A0ABM6IW67_9BACL|nr:MULTISPECIES: GNAT family N-acetyltransferase [Planococcus]AQU80818.1 GNAT family N-acetyltransferase [Planococcus faecalis]MDJ0332268.1 GNAT family N-acetyltransferase [Planococcus sp. S3-L1]OHX55801.1 acetyltransferase [Planococcus faecalis]
MKVELIKAEVSDAPSILAMQKESFMPLLVKYQDMQTNPANETLEQVLTRITMSGSFFYKIVKGQKMVGAIRVKYGGENCFWISPIFVDPQFQGLGVAKEAMKLVEERHAEAHVWELATILEEEANCRFYEKLGYQSTGVTQSLNSNATLGYFNKIAKDAD